MKKRILALLGALAVALGGLVAVAAPAGAATTVHAAAAAKAGNGVCESGELCFWQNADFKAGRYDAFNSTGNMSTLHYVAACTRDCSLAGTVSSLQNHDSQHWVRLFEHTNYGGLYYWRDHYRTDSQLDQAQNLTIDKDQNGKDWNDRFLSFCFVSPAGPSARCR